MHVLLVEGIGARLDRHEVGDTGQPDRGPEQVDQGKGGAQACDQRQAVQARGGPAQRGKSRAAARQA
ncbi:hypothetical protein D3C81_1414000 [compost metagenome]